MSRKSGYLSVELLESAEIELKKLKKDVLIARKLEAIIASCKYGITEVAKVYGITRKTLLFWIKNFLSTKLDNLKAPGNRHRKTILNDSDRGIIKQIIVVNPQVTIDFLVQKALEVCKKKVSYSTMLREVKKMRYSYITPRPQHYKQDESTVEAFKKTSTKN
jgi:transposase